MFLPILEKGNTGKSEALKKKKDLHISRTSLGVQLNFYEDTAAALEVFSGSNFFAQFFSADASFGARSTVRSDTDLGQGRFSWSSQ